MFVHLFYYHFPFRLSSKLKMEQPLSRLPWQQAKLSSHLYDLLANRLRFWNNTDVRPLSSKTGATPGKKLPGRDVLSG